LRRFGNKPVGTTASRANRKVSAQLELIKLTPQWWRAIIRALLLAQSQLRIQLVEPNRSFGLARRVQNTNFTRSEALVVVGKPYGPSNIQPHPCF